MPHLYLGQPLADVPGIRPAMAAALQDAFGYTTVRDLLEHYPRKYVSRGGLTDLGHAKKGARVTVVGEVRSAYGRQIRRNLKLVEVRVSDGKGVVSCTWFNQPWHAKRLPRGTLVAVSGVLQWKLGKLTMSNPDYEILSDEEDAEGFADAVIPVYPATKDVSSGRIRRAVGMLLGRLGTLPELLPEHVREAHGLLTRTQAFRSIHRPGDLDETEQARRRLVYEELFLLQMGLALRRRAESGTRRGQPLDTNDHLTKALVDRVPFTLTNAQKRVISEIGTDLASGAHPMHRLLQGDVGSGKTIIALWTLLCAVQSGAQGAIMAPTEVLADQHFINLSALLAQLGDAPGGVGGTGGLFGGPRIEVLTAAVTGKARQRILEQTASGEVDILVGTHALLSEGVDFKRLAVIVVDEQHRFGVHQRVKLREKGDNPHVLIMTATPIPRTLALTLYGDLDVSVLDELPPGRTPVATHLVSTSDLRERAYQRVREEVARGHQAYVVCALKDDSDGPNINMADVRAAKSEAERLRAEVFPDLRVGLVYGDMPAREKEAAMESFREGTTDVLVSTTVVEVGVDVPNATVMLVEDADRFGLSQLHQLRGRVGRGRAPGLAILFADPSTDEGRARMEAIVDSSDGFWLAEQDLRIRGEGTVFDARQSGLSDLKIARLVEDFEWVPKARNDAFALVDADPELRDPAHAALRAELSTRFSADEAEWLSRG